MGYISSIIILLLLIFSREKQKTVAKRISLLRIFLVLWFLIVFFSNFHFLNLLEISDFAYIVCTLGIISFTNGYWLHSRSFYIPTSTRLNSKEYYYSFRLPFLIILVGAIFIVIKQLNVLLPIILAQGMQEARNQIGIDESLLLPGFWSVALAYFAKPCIMAAMILFLINVFKKKKLEFFTIILLVFLMAVYFFSEGGRLFIMDLIFVVLYLAASFKRIVSKSVQKKIKWGILFLLSLSIIATLHRGSDIWENLNSYYCGSLRYLSEFLNSSKATPSEYLYGFTCYQGFFKPFIGILNLVGFDKPDILVAADNFILWCQHCLFDIYPRGNGMNYYATCFGYSYHDGGLIGVFLCMFFYGMICSLIDKKEANNSNSLFILSIKSVFVYTILFTMAVFPFAKYLYIMTMIFLWILTRPFFSKKCFIDK